MNLNSFRLFKSHQPHELEKNQNSIFFSIREVLLNKHIVKERKMSVGEREREREGGGKTLEGKHVRDAVTSMTQAGTSSHDPERL